VASNDGTAAAAISALPPQLVGKILVTGQDAALDAVQRIVDGKQTMTIYKPIKPLAYSAVDSAIKLAHKEKVTPKTKSTTAKIDVPSILQEPIVVDKNNVMQTLLRTAITRWKMFIRTCRRISGRNSENSFGWSQCQNRLRSGRLIRQIHLPSNERIES